MKLRLKLNGGGVIQFNNVKIQKQNETKLTSVPVAKGARILIKNKPAKLADLKAGMRATLELGTVGEQIVVKAITID